MSDDKAYADGFARAQELAIDICERAATGLRESKQTAADTATYLARDIRALSVSKIERFRCDECKCLVWVDEDGCCTMCGRDTRIVEISDEAVAAPTKFNYLPGGWREKEQASCAKGKHWFSVDADLKPSKKCAWSWCDAINPISEEPK